jgi:hypothetical protein
VSFIALKNSRKRRGEGSRGGCAGLELLLVPAGSKGAVGGGER